MTKKKTPWESNDPDDDDNYINRKNKPDDEDDVEEIPSNKKPAEILKANMRDKIEEMFILVHKLGLAANSMRGNNWPFRFQIQTRPENDRPGYENQPFYSNFVIKGNIEGWLTLNTGDGDPMTWHNPLQRALQFLKLKQEVLVHETQTPDILQGIILKNLYNEFLSIEIPDQLLK